MIYSFVRILCLLTICCTSLLQATLPVSVPQAVVTRGVCGVDATTKANITGNVMQALYRANSILDDIDRCPCSRGLELRRIAYLNMTDSRQQCPENLTLLTSPVRGCGRKTEAAFSCDSIFYSTDQPYSRLCGRIEAIQKGTTDAFHNAVTFNRTSIEEAYVDGVSLTHGSAGSRQHIWTFAAALNQNVQFVNGELSCPCTDRNYNWTPELPGFIQNNYFCDNGNLGLTYSFTDFYPDNPIWDGVGCAPASSCCIFNTPPWFCATLPQPTSDDLELRLCFGEPSATNEENIVITFMDIYAA